MPETWNRRTAASAIRVATSSSSPLTSPRYCRTCVAGTSRVNVASLSRASMFSASCTTSGLAAVSPPTMRYRATLTPLYCRVLAKGKCSRRMRSSYDDALDAVDQEDVREGSDPGQGRDIDQSVGKGSGRAEDGADHERRERPARVGEEVEQAAGQRNHAGRSDVGQQGPGGGRRHPLGEEGDREEQDDERRS